MADFNISRIRFRWRGNWITGTIYVKDDIVRYAGKSYVCLVGHTASADFNADLDYINTATEPDTPAPKWVVWFDGYQWRGDWEVDTFYAIGDIVKYQGIVYICNDSHTSNEDLKSTAGTSPENLTGLEADQSKWTAYAKTDNWAFNWQVDKRYHVNDVVRYRGVIYRCILGHTSAATATLGLEANQSSWTVLQEEQHWDNNWQTSRRYIKGDIVKYGGILYRCVAGHTSAATDALGLEADIVSWAILHNGIEIKGSWAPSFRYKLNDIVKFGAGQWICTLGHTSSTTFQASNWAIYVPGLEYDSQWNMTIEYQPGDVVKYGGYSYYANTQHTNSIPSAIGSLDWTLLTKGFKTQGEWTSSTQYYIGDVVRRFGYLYLAIADSLGVETTTTSVWELLIPGIYFKNRWTDGETYVIGDIVSYISTTYICKLQHTASAGNRPDVDVAGSSTNWTTYIQGEVTNRLFAQGDTLTYDSGSTVALPVSSPGNILVTSNGTIPNWLNSQVIGGVYYVSTNGVDAAGYGQSLNAPFRTIRYACQNVTGPATIFIKTGRYQEQLPISIPADVALVGDELRSTFVEPLVGYELQNMFYVRNGCGIRNMTLSGLTGILGNLNTFLTRRPSAGAYVSLDPGSGPADSSTWITTKSPYIQNVTTFGTACVGLKIDGALHNGGNKSIVANDFTQVLSDGIGVWCTNLGLTELVSVFSYYAHIGYLAENGGKIRATNGNSSYGTYGCVAESVDQTETPITGTVNNRTQEAQVGVVFAGQASDIILALEYTNAGQNYTTASATITGAGTGVQTLFDEFRDNGVFEARLLDVSLSTLAGGAGYLLVGNNAQEGDTTTITLATNDLNEEAEYLGMRIIITSGTGVGQYGYISGYNTTSKIVTVLKESTGTAGWDHVIPGYPIEPLLDTTTVYNIEPRPVFTSPGYSTVASTMPSSATWKSVAYRNGTFVAVPTSTSNVTAYSTNGTTWTAGGNLPTSTNWEDVAAGEIGASTYFVAIPFGGTTSAFSTNGGTTWTSSTLTLAQSWSAVAYGNSRFIAIASGGQQTAISTTGTSWTSGGNMPTGSSWCSLAYGKGRFVAVSGLGSTAAAYSTDNGASWTGSTLPASLNWVAVTYGDNRFVAVASGSTGAAYSFDGVTWYLSSLPASTTWTSVSYGQGLFMAVASGGNTAATSENGGVTWTSRSLSASSSWRDVVFGNPLNNPIWVAIGSTTTARSITTGATAKGRVKVANNKIGEVRLWEPGSGYATNPTLTLVDPNNTSDAIFSCRRATGVLAQPTFLNRGNNYQTSTTICTISGDGFADIFPIGKFITFNGLSRTPGLGANVTIANIPTGIIYKVVKIISVSGGNTVVQIAPNLDRFESPTHGTAVEIREKYSQVRLTGHDFLLIGNGNKTQTNYPGTPSLPLSAENEIHEAGGGRCFYTSTDQDGNFRVGELFKVEQSTGIVTISADFFELTGLEELSLGGFSVGGSAVVIREFSTDPLFTADSDNVVPTQKAIKAYISRRISGGGADAQTGILIAGTVRLGPQQISSTTGLAIKIPEKMRIKKGIDGSMLALTYFADSFSSDAD